MKKILLPELGEGIDDVEIRDVLVKEGESIEKNQSILILETDKASMEIPSDYSGIISKIHVKSGDNISPNHHIIDINDSETDDEELISTILNTYRQKRTRKKKAPKMKTPDYSDGEAECVEEYEQQEYYQPHYQGQDYRHLFSFCSSIILVAINY